MRVTTAALFSVALLAAAQPAWAGSVIDPTGDFLPTYTGPLNPDLDVTSFSVNYNVGMTTFTLSATFAGTINLSGPGFYVFGVNNGSAGPSPFANIGQENVRFNQALVVNKDGTTNLANVSVSFAGSGMTVILPLSSLNTATATLAPELFGFNLWPRVAPAPGQTGSSALISDFAPNNSTLAAVPEPASWAMLITGFAAVGAGLRRKRQPRLAAA